jgi:glycosyltransferase involved in cell wall biosynthesis
MDFSLLEPQQDADAVRRRLGVTPGHYVVGTSAHLRTWKRIDRLLGAAAEVRNPELRVVIVGDGPDRSRLEAQSASLGLTEKVIFAGWHEHIGDVLQIFDVFCLPSSAGESFGNSAVEAMAMGVPTIAFADGGGLLEHIDTERTGFIVSSQSELVSTLEALGEDPPRRREVAERSRSMARSRYTLERSAEAYRRLYDDAMSAPPIVRRSRRPASGNGPQELPVSRGPKR